MGRKAVAVSFGVILLALLAWLELSPGELHVGSLRVVPPAPGECVGRVEVTVVNRTREAVDVGGLSLQRDEKDGLFHYFEPTVFPVKEGGAELVTFPIDRPVYGGLGTLEPGSSRVLTVGLIRVRDGAAARLSIHGVVYARPESAAQGVPLKTPPVDIDAAAWPLPAALGPEALDRTLREGKELSIVLDWAHLPGGGGFHLQIGPGGRAHGEGWGDLPGRGSWGFRAVATLTPEQRASLRAAVKAAPLSAFNPDAGNLDVDCGRPVRLVVVLGPAAFAGGSQEEDFDAAGLAPLLEHLRLLVRGLPDAEGGR